MNETLEQPTTETEKTVCFHSWTVELYEGKEKCMHCGRIDTHENFKIEKALIILSM
ncbi:MAG: hypothetical protein PHC61_02860 [Chitinivibrionales bacterium]|nr:hypothetical protein [Chitinivibrionales bacterium]